MELITDLKAIRKEMGLRREGSSLYPKLNLDAYKDVTPILIKKKKNQYALLVKGVETGNFTPGGAAEPVIRKHKVKIIYYSSYFTWEKLARQRRDWPIFYPLQPREAASILELSNSGRSLFSKSGFTLTKDFWLISLTF